jgi:hypothetical protein
LHNIYYPASLDVWETVYLDSDHGKTTRKQQSEILDEPHPVPFNVPLEKVKQAVLPEFTGPLPVARFDCFSIHTSCAELLAKVSEVLFSAGSDISAKGGKASGVHIIDHVLKEIMDHLRDDFRSPILPYFRR